MSDEEAIRRTLALYCHYCDDGRFEEFADLYTEDATFSVMGDTHQGPDAIRSFIEAAQPPERRGKHMCANPLIDVDGDEASAATDFVFVSRAGSGGGMAVTVAGRYQDRLVRDGERWRFAERRIEMLPPPGQAPDAPG